MQTTFNEHHSFTPEENLKRMSSGVVLCARDVLLDPNFESTIILICMYGEDGAYGLVLNRPAHMPLSEIFDGIASLQLKRDVYIGGPVQQNELQIIQLTETPVENAIKIAPWVYMGGKWDSTIHMIESDPSSTHLFIGYSGWGPEQLEGEILAGAWDVYQVNLKKLLSNLEYIRSSDSKQTSNYLKKLCEK